MDTNIPRIDTGALLATEAAAGFIENKTFDEIAIGENAELTRTVTQSDIELFASVSGDVNPAHLDPAILTMIAAHNFRIVGLGNTKQSCCTG